MNDAVFYSDLRLKMKMFFDNVCSQRIPLLVKRKNGGNVVVVSEQDYRSLEETAYLLSSPKNVKRLLESMNRDKKENIKVNNIADLRNEIRI